MTDSERSKPAKTSEDGDPEAEEAQEQHPIARFVHEHPGMTIAGGIAIGVLAAALLPKRNREFVTEKSSALADAVSAAGLMLYREALDRAETASDGIRDITERFGPPGAGNAASDDGDDRSGRSDLAEGLASIIRHLRGRSRD